MCGIFGITPTQYTTLDIDQLKPYTDQLFKLSQSRGKEASGIAVKTPSQIAVLKSQLPATKFIKTTAYDQFQKHFASTPVTSLIGHSRLATHGHQLQIDNNQPVISKDLVMVHNGIITNDQHLWKQTGSKQPQPANDSQTLVHYLNQHTLKATYQDLEGSASLAILNRYSDDTIITTNTGSLYFMYDPQLQAYIFASESVILRQLIQNLDLDIKRKHITHVTPKTGVIFNRTHKKHISFILTKSPKHPTKTHTIPHEIIDYTTAYPTTQNHNDTNLYLVKNSLKQLKTHDFPYKKIYALKRCTKCILPETTPFITFDHDGVCNYCHTHTKIRYKGIQELKQLIKPYKKNNGKPDCMIAFSGGRDSSYGLHFLKKKLGLNPLAYTYDWGMVTDIGRRNQARMIGKLGIEHIIISANITTKRQHIRKHIKAWMKQPDLGMVPLFMEGDKQCEYYADQLMKKYDIKLMFFCRGNEYEKEEFKTGHCGVKDADPGGVIHNLSPMNKLRMAIYYGKQYLTNPAYINTSIGDTLLAYYATYLQKHDYIFLWHYVPWDEHTIINTLKKNYNWESSTETKATWRTDDGTSSFYNYIYYMGQGFTENDSFRARQVREGKLTRGEALELAHEENKPRYHALKWYFDSVGLDGDMVLSVIDTMPKLY